MCEFYTSGIAARHSIERVAPSPEGSGATAGFEPRAQLLLAYTYVTL